MPIIHHILSCKSSLGIIELWTSGQFLNFEPSTDTFFIISEHRVLRVDKTYELLHEFDDPRPIQQFCGLEKEAEQPVLV